MIDNNTPQPSTKAENAQETPLNEVFKGLTRAAICETGKEEPELATKLEEAPEAEADDEEDDAGFSCPCCLPR